MNHVVVAVIAIGLCALGLTALGPQLLGDPDVQWHTATGQWILAHGFPRADIFSHTRAGTPWVDQEWLSQVIMALVYLSAGWQGLVALGSLTIAFTFVLLYRYLEGPIGAWPACAVALVAIAFAAFHFSMRPHLLALPILVVWTGELARGPEYSAANLPRFSWQWRHPDPWYLLPLMLLWTQLHGSFILAPVIAFGMGFPTLAVVSAAVALVNPYGWGYYEMALWQYQHMDNMRQTIVELRPIDGYLDAPRIAVLIAGLGLLLWRGVRMPILRAGLLCGILFMSLQHWRGLAFLAMTAPIIATCKRRY